jgi:DNA invertase Pin-like site-specific DNA recombinase
MKAAAKRAALYLRVSTLDKQHPANQTAPLTKWCKQHGYTVAHIYTDRESGAEPERPEFKAMMKAAAHREFGIIVCWSLDRFSREGIAQTFIHLKALKEAEVTFYSLTEEYFRTSGPAAEFLIAITAWIADHERRRRQERIRAGLERARAEGTWIGRRPRYFAKHEKKDIEKRAAAGESLREIALKVGSTKSTIGRYLAHIRKMRARKDASGTETGRRLRRATLREIQTA